MNLHKIMKWAVYCVLVASVILGIFKAGYGGELIIFTCVSLMLTIAYHRIKKSRKGKRVQA